MVTQERLLQGARNLKAKGYSPEQVDSWLKTKGSSLEAMKTYAADVQRQETSAQLKKGLGDYFMDNLADIGYGAKRALSGLTFGGSDWALRKMGINDDEYLAQKQAEGLGDSVAAAGLASEIGANIIGPGKLLAKGLTNAGLKGYKLATTAGGLEGLLYGLTGADTLAEIPEKATIGTITGGLFGAGGQAVANTLGAGLRAAQRARKGVSSDASAIKRLEQGLAESNANPEYANKIVNDALDEAERTGRSIIEVADDPIIDVAQEAKLKTPYAKNLMQRKLESSIDQQPAELRQFIDDTLGTQTRGGSIREVTEKARAEAAPIYKDLESLGDLAEYEAKNINPQSRIASLTENNPVLSDTISRVQRANSSLRDLPKNDFRVLNEARRALSEQSMNYGDLSGYEARTALREFDNVLDDVIPQYSKARKIYSNAHRFEDAADMSKNVFNKTNPDDFAYDVSQLSQGEKDALAVGLRDELMSKIGARENAALGFKGLLPYNTQSKIKTALGDETGEKILNKAKEATTLNRNYNTLYRGSQTAEKQSLRDKASFISRLFTQPTSALGELVNPVDALLRNQRNVSLAKAITNPDIATLRKGLMQYNDIDNLYRFDPRYNIGASGALNNELLDEL